MPGGSWKWRGCRCVGRAGAAAALVLSVAAATVRSGEDFGDGAERSVVLRHLMAFPEAQTSRLTPPPARVMNRATRDAMVDVLNGGDGQDKIQAAWSLGEAAVNDDDAVAAVAKLLSENYAPARITALYMLGRSGRADLAATVAESFSDPDEMVRAEACRALAELARRHGGARPVTPIAGGDLPTLYPQPDADAADGQSADGAKVNVTVWAASASHAVLPPAAATERFTPGMIGGPPVVVSNAPRSPAPAELWAAAWAEKLPWRTDPSPLVRRAAVETIAAFYHRNESAGDSAVPPALAALRDQAAERLRDFRWPTAADGPVVDDFVVDENKPAPEDDHGVAAALFRLFEIGALVRGGNFAVPEALRAACEKALRPAEIGARRRDFDEVRLAALRFLAALPPQFSTDPDGEPGQAGNRVLDLSIPYRDENGGTAPLRRAAVEIWERQVWQAKSFFTSGSAPHLGRAANAEALRADWFFDRLDREKDATVRARALLALLYAPWNDSASAALANALNDPARQVRRAAAWTLARRALRDDALRREVEKIAADALATNSQTRRCEGLWILGQLGSDTGKATVVRLAQAGLAPDGPAAQAALALRTIGAAMIVEGGAAAERAFFHESVPIRLQGGWALGRLRYAAAAPAMLKELERTIIVKGQPVLAYTGPGRLMGYWALTRIGGEPVLKRLLALATRDNPGEDVDAAEILANELIARRAEWAVEELRAGAGLIRRRNGMSGMSHSGDKLPDFLEAAARAITDGDAERTVAIPATRPETVEDFFIQVAH